MWRKDNMVRQDVMECCRLAHTLERQIFDLKMYKAARSKRPVRKVVVVNKSDTKGAKMKTDNCPVQERTVIIRDEEAELEVEAKVFELLDLFMRDS